LKNTDTVSPPRAKVYNMALAVGVLSSSGPHSRGAPFQWPSQ